MCPRGSSVRRILKRGGRNFRKFEKNKDHNKKLLNQKSDRYFAKVRWRVKKGLHSNLVRFFAQSWVQAKTKRLRLPFVCSNLLPNLQRGGGMPQFCILFYANYTILATQRGSHGPMSPPPKHAPASRTPPLEFRSWDEILNSKIIKSRFKSRIFSQLWNSTSHTLSAFPLR